MRLEDLEQKNLKDWTLNDVHYMQLKDKNDDFLIKKGKKLVVVTTDKKYLKQIWESSWPRRVVTLSTVKALINEKESKVVVLDGKTDSENLFLLTGKNIKDEIENQNFSYFSESEVPEAKFPE
jgi:hypothetical protein